MRDGSDAQGRARVDPMGRPLEGRRAQAITSASIVVSWICLTILIFWATQGAGPVLSARFFAGMAIVAWLCAEAFGRSRGLVWPASALAIAGSLSLGFSVGLATSHLREPDIVPSIAIITGVAALSMSTYLFRFRLPGLVSPIITFSIVALFLTSYGLNADSLAKVEGLSPRGILAALISTPIWMAMFGTFGAVAVLSARWLDLRGDDFGLASARPLHLVGAGVTALVIGRLLGDLAHPWDMLGLIVIWIAGYLWALRINRFAVMVAVHLAIARPLLLIMADMAGIPLNPGLWGWTLILIAIAVIDFGLWPTLHRAAMRRNWILGPGGRVPKPRPDMGWWWRYWPYA